jgi:hypothetical protein
MKHLSESDEPDNKIMTVIENYNADIQMAVRDGIALDAMIALAGAITQTTFNAMPKHMRKDAWEIMCNIMNKRFKDGEL